MEYEDSDINNKYKSLKWRKQGNIKICNDKNQQYQSNIDMNINNTRISK